MRRNRLLLPWGLLAGLLIAFAVVEGLNIKPPSLLKKQRNYTTTTPWSSTTKAATTTTTTTTETPETTVEAEHDNSTLEGNGTTKSPLSGIPQIDYVLDPNLPRELPRGYNLSEYPFFDRVPNDIVFECDGLLDGFYASIFYKCQIYHHCVSGIRYDFLCANYTAFDQRTFICQFVSEVDCTNSAKWFFRNEPLYKGRITTTSSTTTVATTTTAATRRPPVAGGAGRRRRPFRRRRPQYDYYDDDYEDYEYDDDQSLPPAGNRQRKRQRRPSSGSLAAADAGDDVDDKSIRAPAGGGGGSVYDRPRVLPKIRRPVPKNEREKYDYVPKGGGTDNGDGEKRVQEITERSTSVGSEREPERPKRPIDTPAPAPAPEAEKPRSRPQKQRPQEEDDEYYDDEDYDQPIRTSSRKNNQDYYAPSGGDRDFSRRPAMSGSGRPLRRNRPGRRKPAPVEYDDDEYEDDRRPFRPSAPALEDRRRPDEDRRRPSAPSRKRPYQRDDYDRDSTYDRSPSYRDSKKPQSSRETYDRPATPNREPAYERTATSTRDIDRKATPTRESANERAAPSKREPAYERVATPSRGERPTTSNRDTTYERQATPTRDTANERPATSSRDSVYERAPSSNTDDRTQSKDTTYERLSGSKKRTQSAARETTNERTRSERPSSRTSPDYDRPDTQTSSRPLTSRNRYTPEVDVESDEPIPAARPAYISTTGRSSYRKRGGQEEPVTASGSRGVIRTTPKATEPPPLLDDEEYYDDEEEEELLEEELPKKPTGSGKTETGSYQDTPVDSRKAPVFRSNAQEEEVLEEPRTRQNGEVRGKVGQAIQDNRERGEKVIDERERISQQVPPTGRERPTQVVNDGRTRTRQSYADDERSEVDIDVRANGGKTSANREQSRPDTSNYRASEAIIEQPPLRTTQSNYRTKEQQPSEELVPQRQPFRPKGSSVETTSEASQRYNNFRRKSNQASNIESTRVLPSRTDQVVEIAEDIHIAPSSQGRSQSTGSARDEIQDPLDVDLESDTLEHQNSDIASKQLDTSKFTSSAEVEAQKKVTPSVVPSQQDYNNDRNVHKSIASEPFVPSGPSGRGGDNNNNRNVQKSADVPHRIELPDINDPEYDVTLNEALHPTRPILLSTEGGKTKNTNYQYRDVSIEPDLTGPGSDKLSQTLLTSASQTHVSKAPFPAHAKNTRNYQSRRPVITSTSRPIQQYEDHTLSRDNDYEDPPIPTGRGGSTRTYATTESIFRATQQQSPISLSSRGASGQQFPVAKNNNQYVQFPASPATGTLRQLEQELAKSYPRGRVNHQPYRPPSQGTIREADLYRTSVDPVSLSLGYDVDYEQAAKYRPRRKLVWRDRLHDVYNLY